MCVTITLLYYFSFLETRLVSVRGCLRLGSASGHFWWVPLAVVLSHSETKKQMTGTAQSPEVLEDGVWWGGMG